jgi:hypothetical protein
MRQFITAMAGGLILLGSAAVSAQPQNAAVIAKRQLSECMTRQMAANKAVSYNAALRVCKERLQPPKETLASISPADAGAKSR